jgi:PilZ domain
MVDEDRSQESSGDERRQFDRARLIVDVHFDGGDATGVASTQDISMGGLYMSTQTNIPVGETLVLRIPLAGQHVVVKGDVVYSNPGHGVGVRFHRLSNEERELMERELPKP